MKRIFFFCFLLGVLINPNSAHTEDAVPGARVETKVTPQYWLGIIPRAQTDFEMMFYVDESAGEFQHLEYRCLFRDDSDQQVGPSIPFGRIGRIAFRPGLDGNLVGVMPSLPIPVRGITKAECEITGIVR